MSDEHNSFTKTMFPPNTDLVPSLLLSLNLYSNLVRVMYLCEV